MALCLRTAVALAAVLGFSAAGAARADTTLNGFVSAAFASGRSLQVGQAGATALQPGNPATPGDTAPQRRPGSDSAQRRLAGRTPSGHLRLSFAAAHATVLDPLASPMRYGGAGPGAAAAFLHGSPGGALEVSLEVSAPRLRSALSSAPNGPRESTLFAALRAVWLRRLGGADEANGADGANRAHGSGFLVGAEGRFEGSVRDHRYRKPALDFFYGLALASLGPAARWRADGGRRGELSVEVAAPLVALAYRPYCDLGYVRSGVHPRVAAPPVLGAVDAGAAWAVPLSRSGARAVAEWRLAYLRYRDHDLYRSARQRVGLALDLPTGYRR